MADFPESWLQEGMAAARAGDAERARACLLRVVEADERNVQAWYWLSRVVARPEEREICLENVLALDPAHTAVQAELAALRRQRVEAEKAAGCKPEACATIPLTAEEQLISDAAIEPLHCPYCGVLAATDERQCPACGRDLYVRERKSKGHSLYSLGLVVAWFGLANYIWLALCVAYLLAGPPQAQRQTIGAAPALQRTLETLGNWLGLHSAQARDACATSLLGQGVPLNVLMVAGGAAFLFSLLVAVGLYRRLRFFYWLTIGAILLGLMAALFQAIQAETLPLLAVVIAGVLSLLALSFAFMAYDEFAWVERRLDAAVDSDVDSPSALYARGRNYAAQGMWAKAAAHWSRAVALSPAHAEYRLALATAYVNLGQPERALEHVQEAREIEPLNPGLLQSQDHQGHVGPRKARNDAKEAKGRSRRRKAKRG